MKDKRLENANENFYESGDGIEEALENALTKQEDELFDQDGAKDHSDR